MISKELTVMTYNVENLFDTEHDKGKSDYTYLPKSKKKFSFHKSKCRDMKKKRWRDECLQLDWNESVLKEKLKRIAKVINRYGPDVVILQEVENLKVLKRLNKGFLKKQNYQTEVLLEGRDIRGIDIAVLSRFSLKRPAKHHTIPFKYEYRNKIDDTREILQVDLRFDEKKTLTVFGVHFPAPFHPFGMRKQAMEHLNKLASQVKSSDLIISGGDYNVVAGEDSRIYRLLALPEWDISHHKSCFDCLGTNYFPPKKSWSFLDAIMVYKKSQLLLNNKKADFQAKVGTGPYPQTNFKKQPQPFKVRKGRVLGVSDHLPVIATISY